MAEDIGSTVPRRQLGRLLRPFGTEAGVTRVRQKFIGAVASASTTAS